MKTNLKITGVFLLFIQLVISQVQESWHNHEHYKEELLKNIKKNPDFVPEKTNVTPNATVTSKLSNFKFINGINIAWINFGRDIGKESNGSTYHPDLTAFSTVMDKVANANGDVIRWWYHTNGSTNPVFDNNDDFVVSNPAFFATDLLAILDLAASKGLKVQICLWSFDMLKGGQWNVNSARNKKILTQDAYLQAYLNNALLPLVATVGNHPGLYAWEIFNEPEGMTNQYASHWPDFTDRVTITDIQWMINKTTAAIKTVQPNVKVTSGALGFVSGVDNNPSNYVNEYSDQKLIAAGGEVTGILDFYNIHYYNWAGTNGSPFHNEFNVMNLDKPTVIAEYYPIDTFGVTTANLGSTLLQKGWAGSLVWSWTDKPWNQIEPVLLNLSSFLSINNYTTIDNVNIYPNPVKDKITISGIKQNTTITIYDLMGKNILSKSINSSNATIDLSHLPKGIYILSLKDALQTSVIKITKE